MSARGGPSSTALAQVTQYLSDQPYVDPQTPHFIDIGGNDILALLLAVRRRLADLARRGRPARCMPAACCLPPNSLGC
jgi:hypothetical protein